MNVSLCVCVSVAGCCSYFCFHWVHNASIECTHRVQWVSGWRIYRTTVVKRSHGFFGSIWLIYPMNAKFIQVKLAPLIGSFSVCVCVFICINFVCNRRMIVIAQLRGLFFISIVFLHIRFLFFFCWSPPAFQLLMSNYFVSVCLFSVYGIFITRSEMNE